MFSNLDEPLPNPDKVLERIGCKGLEIRHDIETLDRIVSGFLTHVPFENLSVSLLGEIPSLASKDLYEKIVDKRRGGYCFEMNGFMRLLLRDLGFEVYSVAGYVMEYLPFMGPLSHRANVVILDGKKYLVDVGFGGGNVADLAVPMDGSVREGFFVSYDEKECEYTLCREVNPEEEISKGHGDFLLEKETDGRKTYYVRIIMFRDVKAYPQDFYLPNIAVFYTRENPIISNVIVNLKNEKGEVFTIFNDEFRGKTDQGEFSEKIENEEELKTILRERFGMII